MRDLKVTNLAADFGLPENSRSGEGERDEDPVN
jgi:hypothetical protein